MSGTAQSVRPPDLHRSPARTVARWMITFAGFPLGGLAAMIMIGPVDSIASAAAGGGLTGLILGAVQAWGLRRTPRWGLWWAAATAVGLAIGLAVSAYLVGFGTGLTELVVQGAVSGAAVGAAQAAVLVAGGGIGAQSGDRPGSLRIGYAAVWPIYLAVAWAVGWTVTTAIGVRVEDQFTVFGSAGAVTVAALTVPLPLLLRRRATASDRRLDRAGSAS